MRNTTIAGTLLLVLTAAACGRSEPGAPRAADTPAPGAPAAGTTTAPSGPRVYVSDETGGNVFVIDAASARVIETIPVGKRPRGIRLTHDGTQLLVALSGSPIAGPGVDESKLPPADRTADGIGLLDLSTLKVVRNYPSGQDPEAFDLSPDGRTLYVSNEDAAQMSVVDLTSGSITSRAAVGEEPEGVTVRPDGNIAIVRSRTQR